MKKVSVMDRRTVRTKKLIWDTFREMLLEMELEAITVKELSERAGINRKTFYAHYDSIEALSEAFALELIGDFMPLLGKKQPHEFRETLMALFRQLCTKPEWQQKLFCNPNSFFARQLLNTLYDERAFFNETANTPDEFKAYLKCRYLIAASMELFRAWMSSGKVMEVEEFVDFATGLLCKGEEYV